MIQCAVASGDCAYVAEMQGTVETCSLEDCARAWGSFTDGYVQGVGGVPSVSCPAGCTLSGDGSGETCTPTTTDCAMGYTAGDWQQPSASCPTGCVFTPGTSGACVLNQASTACAVQVGFCWCFYAGFTLVLLKLSHSCRSSRQLESYSGIACTSRPLEASLGPVWRRATTPKSLTRARLSCMCGRTTTRQPAQRSRSRSRRQSRSRNCGSRCPHSRRAYWARWWAST